MSSTTSANVWMTQSWRPGSSGRAAGVPGGSWAKCLPGLSTFVGRLMARLPDVATLKAATGREGPVAGARQAATAGGPSPGGQSWPVELQVQLRWAGSGEPATNHYETRVKA